MLLYEVTVKLTECFDGDPQVLKNLNTTPKAQIVSEGHYSYKNNAGHNVAPSTSIPATN
ncbi:hypothetical protein [Candidatus Odyssella acanthamoebae]|uniref:hypothetical protein n=1 Tax=Candidatus Odyssella acanthamoebae TaxID=91604 RepID=UPI0012EBA3D6|nr:hypothetical protein [Candidatus Paracaedibacter acanthamoebae]